MQGRSGVNQERSNVFLTNIVSCIYTRPGQLVLLVLALTCAAAEGDVVRQEALLAVEQLLGGHVDLLGLALLHRHLAALVPGGLLAVRPGLGAAVRRLVDLASEGVGHLPALTQLALVSTS